jgi:hypothetical protein
MRKHAERHAHVSATSAVSTTNAVSATNATRHGYLYDYLGALA